MINFCKAMMIMFCKRAMKEVAENTQLIVCKNGCKIQFQNKSEVSADWIKRVFRLKKIEMIVFCIGIYYQKMKEENVDSKKRISYFLFINSRSGGEKGKKYLTVPNRKLSFRYANSILVTLYLIDLFSSEQKQQALRKITRLLDKVQLGENRQVKVIVCGGDGSVIWVVQLLAKSGINTDYLVFGIIPIGTGNDFSRCLGWGGSPISFSSDNINPLKSRIIEWLQADEQWFDLWTVELNTYKDGSIFQIRNKNEVNTGLKQLTRGFCNYFGVGTDARICYSVEKHRQKNKWLNLTLYGCIGLCKFFKGIRPTHQAINQFKMGEIIQHIEQEEEQKQPNSNYSNISNLLVKNQSSQVDSIELIEGYGSILALNSVRYMAGLKNVWNTNKLGIKGQPIEPFTPQKFDDGKIQFVGFKNELRLGLQRFVNSGARICQGEGPFCLNFRRTESEVATFVHIDGEAMKVYQLRSVVIRNNELVRSSRIRVLMKKEED